MELGYYNTNAMVLILIPPLLDGIFFLMIVAFSNEKNRENRQETWNNNAAWLFVL